MNDDMGLFSSYLTWQYLLTIISCLVLHSASLSIQPSIQSLYQPNTTLTANDWPPAPCTIPLAPHITLQILTYGSRIVQPSLKETMVDDLASIAAIIDAQGGPTDAMSTQSLSYGILQLKFKAFGKRKWIGRSTFLQLLYSIGALILVDGAVEIESGVINFGINRQPNDNEALGVLSLELRN